MCVFSHLVPHNELQKFHSTAKHWSKPLLTTTSSILCVISKASAFDYTKSLRSFVEIWIMLHIPSELSRRPKNQEERTAVPGHKRRRAGFTCGTTGFLILLLVFTASLNKPLVFYGWEKALPLSQLNSNIPSLHSFTKKLGPFCLLQLLEICFIAVNIAALNSKNLKLNQKSRALLLAEKLLRPKSQVRVPISRTTCTALFIVAVFWVSPSSAPGPPYSPEETLHTFPRISPSQCFS